MFGTSAFVSFLLTIPAANWLIGNVGTVCLPQGPCLLPVGFGLLAPSGVYLIGFILVLRDVIQNQLGQTAVLVGISLGAVLSMLFATPGLAMASAAAFFLSESIDWAVYTPLRERNLALAVLFSGLFGALVDSSVFLILAFNSLEFLPGQFVGKSWVTLAAFSVLSFMRQRRTA